MTSRIQKIKKNLSVVEYSGDYAFDEFLKNGGASGDREVLSFITRRLLASGNRSREVDGLAFSESAFGCSTFTIKDAKNENHFLTGRNFDWQKCDALIVVARPSRGYDSISTVNVDFIKSGSGAARGFLKDEVLAFASLYAPLDGMNEKGLCVAVNMISDSATINQRSERDDITTTTAIRLLLDKAATVDEAISLLQKYDMHASMNYMVHFFVSDVSGKSVAVEYVDNEMSVIETPILTNFYLTQGRKFGVGTSQSHTRFKILEKALEKHSAMNVAQAKDVLESVAKKNFTGFESTEWSIVFDRENLCANYCHREKFSTVYKIALNND